MYKYMEAGARAVYSPRMAPAPAVVLSPHLDDAVLSCWHVLSGPGEVTVINVFAGFPTAGSGASWWDRMTGAGDSTARMAERHAEDRAACAMAGRTATYLEFLDDQYDPPEQSVDEIASALRDVIDPDAVVYAPAALGDHADHEQVRAAALELASSGQRVRLYADHPHAVRNGWPAWVTGAEPTAADEVAAHWDRRLGVAGVTELRPAVHQLNDEQQHRKLQAASAYRTQMDALASAFAEVEGFPAIPVEIVWPVS
jgi:LmbE family N-acetylglucosaminyl deacetylase